MLTTLLITGALAADCDRSWSRKAVLAAVSDAEQAHAQVDVDGLHAAADRVRSRVPCVGEPLTVDDAARVHRVEALSRFAGGDHDGAAMAFAASRSLDPDWVFPVEQVPDGHPLQAVYRSVPIAGAAYAGVPSPAVGHVLIDGAERRGRPRDWPAVVQVVDDDGVLTSAYLWPDEPFPQVATDAEPLALFETDAGVPAAAPPPPPPPVSGGFVPPTRDRPPPDMPPGLDHRRADVRYDTVESLERRDDSSALVVWVVFTDPSLDVALKAWRVLRARTRAGVGDQDLQVDAVRWLAEHGRGQIKAEARELLPRLPVD